MTRTQIKKKLNLDGIGPFQEGRAWVEKNGKRGHVDLNGKVTTPIVYDYVSYFKKGRAWVKINKEYIYINKNGYPIEHKDYYKLIKGIFI